MGMEMSSADMGAVGIVMRGCMKVDDDDEGVGVRMHESHGAGDRRGRRVVRMWEHREMGKSGCV